MAGCSGAGGEMVTAMVVVEKMVVGLKAVAEKEMVAWQAAVEPEGVMVMAAVLLEEMVVGLKAVVVTAAAALKVLDDTPIL